MTTCPRQEGQGIFSLTILITGITGFLGTRVAQEALSKGFDVVGLSHSEIRDKEFNSLLPNVKTYSVDIAHDSEVIDSIVKKHKVDYIVHTAAMKHVGVCESNPTKAIDVNVLGSKALAYCALRNNVKNIIAVSTDKSINPSCVYGSTKFLMEKLMLEMGYSVFQGVNFFFSTGSVLDLWDSCRKNKEPLGVNTTNMVRYFVDAKDVAAKIIENLDNKGSNLCLDTCYKVTIHDLYEAYSAYHRYSSKKDYVSTSAEKLIEELPDGATVIDATFEILINKLREYYGDS